MKEALKTKSEHFQEARELLTGEGLRIIDQDDQRPWGFFVSVDESQAPQFIERFYEGVDLAGIDTSLPLRPKILGIAPHQRLSWQWHHRRSEKWRCISGCFEIILSDNDEEAAPQFIGLGQSVLIPQGVRHRGIGLENWAFIAEIWQHTDPKHPSNEDDIVRVQDDFGRQ